MAWTSSPAIVQTKKHRRPSSIAHDPEPLLMSDIPVHLIDGVLPVESFGVSEIDAMLGEVLPALGFVPRHHLM